MSPQKNLCVSALLDQMTEDYHFPEEAEGKEIFSVVAKEQLLVVATKQKVPFGIEIDMEQDTVTFHFKEGCKNCGIIVTLHFPEKENRGGFGGTRFYCAADNLKISVMMDGAGEPSVISMKRLMGK